MQCIGDITGSKHDFSGLGWSESEICKPCHTPHHADLSVTAPLWNHELTQATYELYDSEYLINDPEQPGEASLLCLSCHDGTVALDSYGGSHGATFISGDALIGTDLRNDHPIGIAWTHQYKGSNCTGCHGSGHHGGGMFDFITPFYDGKVECMSCHEPHNSENVPFMLRMSNIGSAMCLICHPV